ncbi:unnamed protein product [Arabidopsis arenosa]|uniref:DUF3511 domain protein (DUF3511) n=2 Tax=Arabidopsis TaxID=3701 RepID=A0A8T1ZTC5_9BRAS|nr:hypothetical protein ISN45_Aa05g031740 [Arabidopsis thaliana x Arabidopsis arenosa]CAE6080775.1 unnamed protein product [Arabidopsis arenosa]
MDGFGSHPRTIAVDRWMEIVNGKGYGVGGARPDSPKFQPSIPPPPGSGSTARTTTTPWRLLDAETKRKKRIATYKTYALEGKVKTTVKKGFRWIKNRYSQIIHG